MNLRLHRLKHTTKSTEKPENVALYAIIRERKEPEAHKRYMITAYRRPFTDDPGRTGAKDHEKKGEGVSEYQISISYNDGCNIAPFVDAGAFNSIVEAVKRRGYEVVEGDPEKKQGAIYTEHYAAKDGKKAFTIGYERRE